MNFGVVSRTFISHLRAIVSIISHYSIEILLIKLKFIQIDSESFLHLYKLLHNGMYGMVVFIWSFNGFDPFLKTRCTGYTIKSMGDRVSCYYSLCHLFIHPATISTHQEYLPIFKTMWTPPLYPYCSSYWEIKSVLTAKYPFDDGMSHFITLKLTTWTRDSWAILLPSNR